MPVVKQVFSGWQFSGVTAFQSGQPFTIVTGVDSNGNGGGGDRPNFNPAGAFAEDPLTHNLRTFTTSKVNGQYLVPLGTNGLPLASSLGNGNLGKNTLRAPGFWNSDISLSKKFSDRRWSSASISSTRSIRITTVFRQQPEQHELRAEHEQLGEPVDHSWCEVHLLTIKPGT
jgi:hypothetical protein